MLDDQLTPAAAPKLVRSLGVVGVLLLTLSVATPASSVFVIVPTMLQVAGTGAVWAMILAALVCVPTAFIYAELSSAYPVAGGEYVMVADTLGPMAGFAMLGVNVFNNLLFPPILGLGIADVLETLVPGLPAIPVALAIIAASTLVAVLQIRINAWVTGLFLLVELVAIGVIVWLGLADSVRPIEDALLHPVMPQAGALVPTSLAAIGVATSIAIFALNGYGAAVYFGEEMHEPERLIARTILAALVLTLLFEGLPLVAGLMGAADLPAFLAARSPFMDLAVEQGGAGLSTWMSIGVVVAIVNAIIACILACSRFFYGTARDGSWGRPVDRWMAQVHLRFGSPDRDFGLRRHRDGVLLRSDRAAGRAQRHRAGRDLCRHRTRRDRRAPQRPDGARPLPHAALSARPRTDAGRIGLCDMDKLARSGRGSSRPDHDRRADRAVGCLLSLGAASSRPLERSRP
ncbi:APC family permease [Sphingomonas sp. R86521]|uniref:APC family permease n=1 Tax=Sphingomonas sp. R86521 TaxID=3093860 RepID=UPI0036D29755